MFSIQSNGISHGRHLTISRCWVRLDPMGSILSKLRETWHAFNGKRKTAKQTKRMFLFYPKRIYEYTNVLERVEYTSAICSPYVIYVKLYIPDAQCMVYLPNFTPQNYPVLSANRPATWGASGYVIYGSWKVLPNGRCSLIFPWWFVC